SRVIFDELTAKLLDGRCLANSGPRRSGILALAYGCEPVFGNGAGLLYRERTELPDRRLATLTAVGHVLDHEDLPTCRRDLQEEPRYDRVPELVVLAGRLRRVDSGLGELKPGHLSSREGRFLGAV